jgi:hypothetical protein
MGKRQKGISMRLFENERYKADMSAVVLFWPVDRHGSGSTDLDLRGVLFCSGTRHGTYALVYRIDY